MKDDKPNYYAIIPAEIRYDNDLRANEKLLYGEITSLAKKSGECWASNNYFAQLYNVKPNAVATWLRHLKQKGYIQMDYEYVGKEIKKRIIKIGGIQKDNRSYSNETLGGIQKDEDNNTIINNKRKYIKEKKLIDEFINENNFSTELENVLNDWIIYKNERNENYTEIGFKKLLAEIKNNICNYSEKQVICQVNKSMSSNWKGIQFQMLQQSKPKKEVRYL